MKQLKPYIDALRQKLQDEGLYRSRNEPLIRTCAMQQRLVDELDEGLRRRGIWLTRDTYGGRVSNEVYNTAVDRYDIALNRLAITQTALGLGNIETDTPEGKSLLDAFLEHCNG